MAEGEREGRCGEGVAPPLPAEELLAVTRREGEVPGLAVPPPPRLGEGEALPPRGPLPGEALVLALPRALEEALGGALSAALGVCVSVALGEAEAGAVAEAKALALRPGMVAKPVVVKLAETEATLVGTCVM